MTKIKEKRPEMAHLKNTASVYLGIMLRWQQMWQFLFIQLIMNLTKACNT